MLISENYFEKLFSKNYFQDAILFSIFKIALKTILFSIFKIVLKIILPTTDSRARERYRETYKDRETET